MRMIAVPAPSEGQAFQVVRSPPTGTPSIQLRFELSNPLTRLLHLRLQVGVGVLPAGHEAAVVVEGFLVSAEGVEGHGAAAERGCK